jgi:hypothetical protein
LVVDGVGRQDGEGTYILRRFRKKFVSCMPGILLEVSVRMRGRVTDREFNAEPGSQCFDIGFVSLARIAAKSVIEMRCNDAVPELLPLGKIMHRDQQTVRIRSAGDGNDYGRIRERQIQPSPLGQQMPYELMHVCSLATNGPNCTM